MLLFKWQAKVKKFRWRVRAGSAKSVEEQAGEDEGKIHLAKYRNSYVHYTILDKRGRVVAAAAAAAEHFVWDGRNDS